MIKNNTTKQSLTPFVSCRNCLECLIYFFI